MSKLDPTFKAEWLAALRSGKYPKGVDQLKTVTAPHLFCCLGVAADIKGFHCLGNQLYLVESEAATVGLTLDEMQYLSAINDTSENFDEVAKYIEEEL